MVGRLIDYKGIDLSLEDENKRTILHYMAFKYVYSASALNKEYIEK